MKSNSGAIDFNTKDCTLEGSEFFGSTKCKLNLPQELIVIHIDKTKLITPFLALVHEQLINE